ncbi:hypothetical protein AAEX28_14625 [Lentisphaerota bacterium WC36G]|nr:hypothetical protein LJT99_01380 [Lentisphaerae bacterium WC36]
MRNKKKYLIFIPVLLFFVISYIFFINSKISMKKVFANVEGIKKIIIIYVTKKFTTTLKNGGAIIFIGKLHQRKRKDFFTYQNIKKYL